VSLFIVTAGDSDEHGPDILVIDDELHDIEQVTQSSVNQRDVYTANNMLVLPDQVSCPDSKITSRRLLFC